MEDNSKGTSDPNSGNRFSMADVTAEAGKDPRVDPSPPAELPQRYVVKDIGGKKMLTCLEAPNLTVLIQAGFTVSAATARKAPPGTIYLDGVAQSEPFLDHEKKIYNLDHHEGCVRTFTLATCEQALVMILKGLDLRDREWQIYANEPDLDTILAIWLIFNHQRISRKEPMYLRFLYALVRLEGVIDALGLELKEFSALPPEHLRRTQRVIDFLRKDEIQLKKDGLWGDVDFLEYTASILHKIDRIIYKSTEFTDFKGIKELARVDLTGDRLVVVVESDTGIYELEPHLNNLYGTRLGLVVLQRSPGAYTLRRMDLFMPGDLEPVYERLNFIDPAVKCRSQNNRWGGSADIGGSPRASGTSLTPSEIAQACRDALQKPSIRLQATGLLKAALIVSAILAPAEVLRLFWHPDAWFTKILFGLTLYPAFDAALLVIVLTGLFLSILSYRKSWQYGLSLPIGISWWLILPGAVLFGFLGGIWQPDISTWDVHLYKKILFLVITLPLALELLFRSLVHGLLTRSARIQHCSSHWFLSWPTVGSAFLYAGYIGYRLLLSSGSLAEVFTAWTTANIFSAFAFGIAAGLVRERSQSFLPAFLFHLITAAAVAAASGVLP
ncbi:MAG: CPBP family intramembrane glutamic endopeptidase [Desulfobacterales bacterium]